MRSCSPEEVIKTAQRMAELGLVVGSFGNVSCRLDANRILITPAKLDYSMMRAEDLVTVDLRGRKLAGSREPSAEFKLHLALYRARTDAQAIVHTHSVHAIALSLQAEELPAFTEELKHGVGGAVLIAPYAPAGSQELADRAAELLANTRAKGLILARHGVVGLGEDLQEALLICQLIERGAQAYLLGRSP